MSSAATSDATVVREALEVLANEADYAASDQGLDSNREILREALDALTRISDALDTLRSAWNVHMETCPQHAALPTIEPPTEAELAAWRDAPSGTASA